MVAAGTLYHIFGRADAQRTAEQQLLSSAQINGRLITKVIRNQSAEFDFKLEQNFPNPFNPSTTIEFSLPRSGHVRLQVVNSLGEVVATLVNEELNVGIFTTEWSANGMASGVYFYRLQVGDFVDTKRLLLLK